MGKDRDTTRDPLLALARRRGVATSYTDAWGRRRRPSRRTLAGVLTALGEDPDGRGGAAAALEAHRAHSTGRAARVIVAWDGVLPQDLPAGSVELEGGDVVDLQPGAAPPEPLPPGVHRLLAAGDRGEPILVIAAPRRPPAFAAGAWGVFAPTYALHDRRRLPRGDLTALRALGRFTASLGGSYVATLPLLATPAGDRSPSPYSPVSRMWWDERFLDLGALPEIAAEAADRPADAGGGAGDPAVARLLDLGAARVAGAATDRGRSYRGFLEERTGVREWAKYRSEEAGGPQERHVYAQWAMELQLAALATDLSEGGCSLLLDLPVGCRPDGFDPWAFPGSFAKGATIGAPPDRFFVKGQDWGLAPLDPEGERAAGYPLLRACLATVLRHAGALRIDHVMGLQRLWWIPAGAPPTEGAYVAYPAEELLAVACLEASRAGACLVGEDLGTVSPALRRLLAAHGIGGTDVAIFQLEDDPSRPLSARKGAMAMIDTHDTATLAGWLAGDDVALRRRLGLLEEADETTSRRPDVAALRERLGVGSDSEVLAALLEELGRSPAGVVVATLEDLWGERDPQNVPGTVDEHANFCRPSARSLEQMEDDPQVRAILGRLDRARRDAG